MITPLVSVAFRSINLSDAGIEGRFGCDLGSRNMIFRRHLGHAFPLCRNCFLRRLPTVMASGAMRRGQAHLNEWIGWVRMIRLWRTLAVGDCFVHLPIEIKDFLTHRKVDSVELLLELERASPSLNESAPSLILEYRCRLSASSIL